MIFVVKKNGPFYTFSGDNLWGECWGLVGVTASGEKNQIKKNQRSSKGYAPTKENLVEPYMSINQNRSESISNNQHQLESIGWYCIVLYCIVLDGV